MNLLGVQLRKMYQRKDVKVAYLLFLVIPLLVAFLIKAESNIITIGDSIFSGIGYVSVVLGLLKGLFVFYILLFLFTTSLIAGEIDSMNDAVYYCKVEKRSSIITSKINALVIMSFLLILDICFSASLGWMLFLRNSKFGSMNYFSSSLEENQFMIMMLVFSFIEIVVLMLLSANISLFLSQGKALMGSFLIIIVFKLIENIDGVQKFVPTYIGNLTSVMELSGNKFWYGILEEGLIFFVYIIVMVMLLISKYKRMDYVR